MRDTIDMARESKLDIYGLGYPHDQFMEKVKAFETIARADERKRTWTQEHWTEYERSIAEAEREACAKVCDEYSATGQIEEFDRGWLACAKNTAAAIRARKETK